MTEARTKGPRIGQRHILVVCSGLGLVVLFAIRMSLPVALVSMISTNASSSHHSKRNDSCPMPPVKQADLMATNQSVHRQFNWDSQTRGLILSSFFWGYLWLQVPAGGLAQRYGARWLIASSIGWCSLLAFLSPLMAHVSPYALMALLTLQGVGSSIAIPSLFALFGRWIPPEENSVLVSIVFSGAYLGTIFGESVAGLLCKSTFLDGWPMVFYLNGTLGVLFVAAWIFLIRNSPEQHPWITVEEKNYIIFSLNSQQSKVNKRGIPWCRILSSRPLIVYVILEFIFGWFIYAFTICFAQYISEIFHQNVAAIGGLLCLPLIAVILMSTVFTQIVDFIRRRGWLSLNTGRKMFTFLGFGGSAAFLFGVTLVNCDILQIELCFILSFALFAAVYAGYMNAPLDSCPEYSGTFFAMGNIFANLSGLVAPIIISKMTADASRRSWNNVLYVSCGLEAFAAILYVLLGTSDRMIFASDGDTEIEEQERLLGNNDSVHVYQ